MTEDLPKRIGRYDIRRELGRGMMGVVYEAHDPILSRTVALKTIHLALSALPGDPRALEERFLAEAHAAARLSHPGIVVVYDMGMDVETGRLYIALEYLVGKTLDAMLAGGRPLEWQQALRITARVAEALHHAHSHGIIHRDIKPANVMILESGQPKIMDFGIAKFQASPLTTAGKHFGSPSYVSPERAMEEPADARSDLFSLGAVVYELLTGRRAFTGPDIPTILMRVVYEDPPPPTQLMPGLPGDVDDVVARALAKAPSDRYPNAWILAQDLEAVLQGRSPRYGKGWRASRLEPKTAVAVPEGRPSSPEVPPGAHDTARSGAAVTLALPSGKRVCLAVLAGPRQGETFTFDRPQCLIGRTEGRANADVEVPDPEVSRVHAVVECHGQRIVLRDLGSTNGTFVAEERIEEREIQDGDEFRLGRTRFMLILADAK